MTFYQKISSMGEVGYLSTDSSGREMFGFNIIAIKRHSLTFEEEIVKLLEAAELGVLGETIFAARKQAVPPGAGPFYSLRRTPGMGPIQTQNKVNAYRRPGMQVIARAADLREARKAADAAYEVLTSVRNQDVTF